MEASDDNLLRAQKPVIRVAPFHTSPAPPQASGQAAMGGDSSATTSVEAG